MLWMCRFLFSVVVVFRFFNCSIPETFASFSEKLYQPYNRRSTSKFCKITTQKKREIIINLGYTKRKIDTDIFQHNMFLLSHLKRSFCCTVKIWVDWRLISDKNLYPFFVCCSRIDIHCRHGFENLRNNTNVL